MPTGSVLTSDAAIQGQASKANSTLVQLIQSTGEHFEIYQFLVNVTNQFENDYVNTRLAALRYDRASVLACTPL